MAPPPITEQITFFYTQDGQTTWRFYEEVIGLTLVVDQGSCRIYRVGRDAYIGFCERRQPKSPDGAIITLVTDDVDGWERHLRANEVPIVTPAKHSPTYGIYQLFARDPNGYLLEVQRFDDPNWAAPEEL